jgi:precorrin-6B methylase 1
VKNNQAKSKRGGARPGAGRPKGVPNKATASIREAAREYTEQALLTLAEVMADEEQPAAARVSAANALLDRGYGKPSQSVDVTGDMTFKGLEVVIRRQTAD